MRPLFIALILLVGLSTAFAGNCGNSRGHGGCKDRPDWGYTYENAYFTPECSTCQLECFHDKLISMMEARKSHESAYIREHAAGLFYCADKLRDADPGCRKMESKHYKRAVKTMYKDCEELKELVFGGATAAVYAQVKIIEDDYVRVINLCE